MSVPWVGQLSPVCWQGRTFRTRHSVLGCWMSRVGDLDLSTTGRISFFSCWTSPSIQMTQDITTLLLFWLFISSGFSLDPFSQDCLQNCTLNHVTCQDTLSGQYSWLKAFPSAPAALTGCTVSPWTRKPLYLHICLLQPCFLTSPVLNHFT